ncbi:MAG: NAD(P)H-dependent oxidoreductase [Acidobacteria bacterium]|nr:NAD(P)H-dependent oxidoreductase [Acidobacteriota bacterium]
MTKRIAIIQGHPDPQGRHFGHALAEAYATSATSVGHTVNVIEAARLDFPLLRSKEEFEKGTPPASIRQAQDAIQQAEHLVFFYPLWMGSMPAILKAFLEQVFRPEFTTDSAETGNSGKQRLKGKSARIVVTMGMPAFFYRWYFQAHSLKSFERNILSFCGIGPIKESLIGQVESSDARRQKWLAKMRAFGQKGK